MLNIDDTEQNNVLGATDDSRKLVYGDVPSRMLYIEATLVFLVVFFISLILLVLWAKIFTGIWLNVQFIHEFPVILSFSLVATLLILVRWHCSPLRGRAFLLAGLFSFTLIWFMIIPIEKYAFVFPEKVNFHTLYIIFPFFFTFSLFPIFSGLRMLLGEYKQKP